MIRATDKAATADLAVVMRIHFDLFWLGVALLVRAPQSAGKKRGAAAATEGDQQDHGGSGKPLPAAATPHTLDVVVPPLEGRDAMPLEVFAKEQFACVPSRSQAKRLADRRRLLINGQPNLRRSRYVQSGDIVTLLLTDPRTASGGGNGGVAKDASSSSSSIPSS